jgi:hypothetical protein
MVGEHERIPRKELDEIRRAIDEKQTQGRR